MRKYQPRQIVQVSASEELDQVAIRDGLGLIPCSLDVHASQWGTVTRLIHAVEIGECA